MQEKIKLNGKERKTTNQCSTLSSDDKEWRYSRTRV